MSKQINTFRQINDGFPYRGIVSIGLKIQYNKIIKMHFVYYGNQGGALRISSHPM